MISINFERLSLSFAWSVVSRNFELIIIKMEFAVKNRDNDELISLRKRRLLAAPQGAVSRFVGNSLSKCFWCSVHCQWRLGGELFPKRWNMILKPIWKVNEFMIFQKPEKPSKRSFRSLCSEIFPNNSDFFHESFSKASCKTFAPSRYLFSPVAQRKQAS